MRLTHSAQRLRQLLQGDQLIIAPGVYDGLSARIVEQAGAAVLYASGGAIARSAGYPDLGLLTMSEMRDRIAEICATVQAPVLADADTGYGNALNVLRTVREFARTGVAAIHLEDQVTPKRCGHYAGKALISTSAMVGKLQAALDARDPDELLVFARTDALSVTGLDDALRRAEAYARAGADAIFVEGPQSREQVAEIARALSGIPLVINLSVGGPTPLLSPTELAAMGYRVMIAPSDVQRAAQRAMERVAAILLREGSSQSALDALASPSERDELARTQTWNELGQRYSGDA